MKSILLIAALIMSVGAKAQTIHLDETSNTAYVNLTPMPIGWLKTPASVDRLYIRAVSDNLVNNATFNWWLKYKVVVDKDTYYYQSICEGSVQMGSNAYNNWDDASKYLFRYVVDSLNIKATITN